jgi:hypothetical protein
MNLELRLSVEDSPNSAGETIDAIRCCKLARELKLAGPLNAVCAYTMKHPPVQCTDHDALQMLEQFIADCTAAKASQAAPRSAGVYASIPQQAGVRSPSVAK